MQKIKTEQPYILYRKIFRDSSRAKNVVILSILSSLFVVVLAVVIIIYQPKISVLVRIGIRLIIPLIAILIYLPIVLYDFKLKSEYEPGISYKHFRDYKKLQSKLPEGLRDEAALMRMENHQDIDFNVKVDLNAIYGVNDKLVMSYQNFNYEKEKMEDGDYLLGVSAQGVYYVCKNQTITKTIINFGDFDTLGLLAGMRKVFVFHIISKQNDEINIILNQNDSLLVSPFMLFNKLLELLDAFIENGGVVSDTSSNRRRISITSGTRSSNDFNTDKSRETSNNREIDISYSAGVLEDMRTATYVGLKRSIDIDTPVTTEVTFEELNGSKPIELEKGKEVSNRSIDIDDIIGSRIADVRRDSIIEEKTTPVVMVPSSQSQFEIPKEKTNELEIPKEETPVLEIPQEEPLQQEQPKRKRKTGPIIGIVGGVLAIGAVVGYLEIRNHKKAQEEARLQEQRRLSDMNTYPWLHGEWRNGVYGDILDVDADGVKFVKNGLVLSEDEYGSEDNPWPKTIETLTNFLPDREKVPFTLNAAQNTDDGKPQISIQFDYVVTTYPEVKKEKIIIGLDTENRLLFYSDPNGKKVFLDKYSDLTFEEQWNAELEKANKQLSQDLANHEYDWLYGTWLDYNDQLVVINQDYVICGNTKQPFKLHYELEDPYNEILDYGLYLYLGDIIVARRLQAMYWVDEYNFYEYQRVSNSSDPVTKVYSNASDGYVNIRQSPESNAPILGVLMNGPEGAILLDTEGEWKKIDCNGIVGYVYKEYVQFTPTEMFEETSPSPTSQNTKTTSNQSTPQSVTE